MEFLIEHIAMAETEQAEAPGGTSPETNTKAPRACRKNAIASLGTPAQCSTVPIFFLPSAAACDVTLQYELQENAVVSLEVFNSIGRRVRLLASTIARQGRHAVSWDGRDDRGRELDNGLYLVKLEAAGESGRVFLATQNVTWASHAARNDQ